MYKLSTPFSGILLFCGAIFCFVMLWLYPQMTHGIYIADTGYHLYESLQAFHAFGRPCPQFWLTSYISGAWLSICPYGRIFLWYALGGAILRALSYVFGGLIIREIFTISLRRLFFLLAVTAVFQLHFLFDFAVQYYSLPFVVAEIALLFYLKYLNAEQDKLRIVYLVCTAIAFGTLPALRIPMIGLVFAPVLYELLLAVLNKSFNWKSLCIYTVTSAIVLGVFYILYLNWSRAFPEYRYGGTAALANHELGEIVCMTLRSSFSYLKRALVGVAFILVLRALPSVKFRWEWVLLMPAVAYVLFFARYYYCNGDITHYRAFIHLLNLQKSIPFLMLLLVLLPGRFGIRALGNEKRCAQTYARFRLTLLLVVGFCILYPFGTDCFAIKTLYSLPILLPLLFILLYRYFGLNLRIVRVIIISMILVALATLPNNIDTHSKATHNRLRMHAPYQVNTLRGMYEEPEKVEAQEKLIRAIQHYAKPNEEILFVSKLYELLPATGVKSWMHPVYFIPAPAQSDIDVYIAHKELPRVAVFVKGAHTLEWAGLWEKKLRALHYRMVYSTDCAMALCAEDDDVLPYMTIWIREEE